MYNTTLAVSVLTLQLFNKIVDQVDPMLRPSASNADVSVCRCGGGGGIVRESAFCMHAWYKGH